MTVLPPSSQRGFTLLETLIAFIVLVFGLLGAVALQAKAKQASFDAMQRAAALGLAHDITERIKSNTAGGVVGGYNATLTSNDTLAGASCVNAYCAPGALAQYDLDEWRKAIKARENTGALSDATVCINATPNAASELLNISVVVVWESRQEYTQSAANQDAAANCAAGSSSTRRQLALTAFSYIRSA